MEQAPPVAGAPGRHLFHASGEDGDFELYNVVGDPSESNDLIRERQDIAARMIDELRAWEASIEMSIAGADYAEESE